MTHADIAGCTCAICKHKRDNLEAAKRRVVSEMATLLIEVPYPDRKWVLKQVAAIANASCCDEKQRGEP